MKLSTRARYGLRLCFLLGISQDNTVSLSSLIKQTGLSEKYCEQLIGKLRKCQVVEAKRGSSGGYYLARPATQITINNILNALEDNFEITDCAVGNCKDEYCPNKRIFSRIYNNMNAILDNTTLQDMIDDYKCV